MCAAVIEEIETEMPFVLSKRTQALHSPSLHLAEVAHELLSLRWDASELHWFHLCRVLKPCLWDPHGALHVAPLPGRRSLEHAAAVGAQAAHRVLVLEARLTTLAEKIWILFRKQRIEWCEMFRCWRE